MKGAVVVWAGSGGVGRSSAKLKAGLVVEIGDHGQHETYIELARTKPKAKRSDHQGTRKGRRHHCTLAIERPRTPLPQPRAIIWAEREVKGPHCTQFDGAPTFAPLSNLERKICEPKSNSERRLALWHCRRWTFCERRQKKRSNDAHWRHPRRTVRSKWPLRNTRTRTQAHEYATMAARMYRLSASTETTTTAAAAATAATTKTEPEVPSSAEFAASLRRRRRGLRDCRRTAQNCAHRSLETEALRTFFWGVALARGRLAGCRTWNAAATATTGRPRAWRRRRRVDAGATAAV